MEDKRILFPRKKLKDKSYLFAYENIDLFFINLPMQIFMDKSDFIIISKIIIC